MSRFRTHDWLYGSLLLLNRKVYVCPYEATVWNMSQYEVIPETVGQFTGLCDMDGKEIYEGDILFIGVDDGTEIFNEVGIKDGCFGYIGEINGELIPFCHCDVTEKIAGNIHNNPELLKEVNHPNKTT